MTLGGREAPGNGSARPTARSHRGAVRNTATTAQLVTLPRRAPIAAIGSKTARRDASKTAQEAGAPVQFDSTIAERYRALPEEEKAKLKKEGQSAKVARLAGSKTSFGPGQAAIKNNQRAARNKALSLRVAPAVDDPAYGRALAISNAADKVVASHGDDATLAEIYKAANEEVRAFSKLRKERRLAREESLRKWMLKSRAAAVEKLKPMLANSEFMAEHLYAIPSRNETVLKFEISVEAVQRVAATLESTSGGNMSTACRLEWSKLHKYCEHGKGKPIIEQKKKGEGNRCATKSGFACTLRRATSCIASATISYATKSVSFRERPFAGNCSTKASSSVGCTGRGMATQTHLQKCLR